MTRNERIQTLVNEGWDAKSIAQILGTSEKALRTKVSDMNLTFKNTVSDPLFGLTPNSYQLRAMLGSILVDLKEQGIDISSITGLNRWEISRAMKHPYAHDWKLSQIERTLHCENKTLKDIICL